METNLTLDGFSLAVNDGVRSHNAIGRRVCLYHLELDGSHASTDHEGIIAVDGAVSLHEVRLEVHFKQISVEEQVCYDKNLKSNLPTSS